MSSAQAPAIRSEYDVVVIGAGAAGISAANAAIDAGARVLLLEKLLAAGGTLPISSGFVFHADHTRDGFAPAYGSRVEGMVSRDFDTVMQWLRDHGVSMVEAHGKHGGYKIEPDPVTGGLEPLLKHLRRAGGTLALGAAARSLELSEHGQVVGVRLRSPARLIRAGAVIIATGGFQGDPELVTRYIGPWERLFWRSNRGTTGDGFRMGLAAGAAATAGLGRFVGHLSPSAGTRVVDLEPEYYRRATLAFIKDVVLLNLSGKRFVDESRQDVAVVNALARDHHATGVAVFDSVVQEHSSKQRSPLPGDARTAFEQWRALGARVATADTLSCLFEQFADLGLAIGTAIETIEAYDRAAQKGDVRALEIPRQSNLHRCSTAPFFAMLVCPDLTYTEGGLRVNEFCQAVDNDGAAIEGLYATGEAAGLVSLASQAGGLATAFATGWRAGRHAASHLRRAGREGDGLMGHPRPEPREESTGGGG